MELNWTRYRWYILGIPTAIMALLTIRGVKPYVIPEWIPLLNAESLTARYLIIPLVVAVVVAAVNSQGFFEKYMGWVRIRLLAPLSLAVLAGFLFNHSRVWRMHRVQAEFDGVVNQGLYGIARDPTMDIALRIQNNMTDLLYINVFWVGLAVSVLAAAAVAVMLLLPAGVLPSWLRSVGAIEDVR